MRKMMKRIAAATIGMAIVMTSTACSSGTGSTTAAPENKETTGRNLHSDVRTCPDRNPSVSGMFPGMG